jgi:hypothetical protein
MRATVNWAEALEAVAAALAARSLSGGGEEPGRSPSLLTAVTGAIPPDLRRRLQPAGQNTANDDVEPLIYQNEFPVRLLADGIVDVAAAACTGVGECHRVTAIVAVSALSTLQLDPGGEATTLSRVRALISGAASATRQPGWTEALDSLTSRTAELNELLQVAGGDRRQIWPRVSLADRILAEAVAAAVVGGSARASGVVPRRWLFPFHLFCSLGVSAARSSASTIERWLGIEFLPAPRTVERAASLATLVADEASTLWQGCGCKAEPDEGELAFARRGPCRQDDHDLPAWQPGQPKPGSRSGARYATTLWGWQRRWLGGADYGRAAAAPTGRPKLRSNDVASCVLARRWLSADRGFGGPVLRYDRILPEFCGNCDAKVALISVPGPAGRTLVQRAPCCAAPRLVYRSEFIWRDGRRLLRPKLGIVITSQFQEAGNAGYGSTEPLGPIWVCRTSGRYLRAGGRCPECGPAQNGGHEPAHHGWVLLPLADAWADLRATAGLGDHHAAGHAADDAVGEADLRFLADICSQLPPGLQRHFDTPEDVWALAKGWSSAEMNAFKNLAERRGLELLLRCRQIAEAQARAARHHGPGQSPAPATNGHQDGIGPGGKRRERGEHIARRD